VKQGDHYVVNGQKTWTSGAHRADWGFLLARTNPEEKRGRGISFFLVDMKTPGITIRPIPSIEGSHLFNEVFLDDVRIPAKNLVGEENQGWLASQMTSNFERSMIMLFSFLKRELEELIELCKEMKIGGRVVTEDPIVRHRLAQLAIEIDAGRAFAYSVVWNQHKGGLVASGHMAAAAKVLATELNQRFFYTGCQILGLFSQVRESKWAPLQGKYEKEYQQCVSLNMGGGTSEIMRNLVCTLGLGLPRSW
jgi:alkylation response protein AidB-like acyl-CoA dehydrogenase